MARYPSLALWLALPLLAWLLARQILVRPAERRLAQAHRERLATEREELAAELAAAKEQKRVRHLRSQISTLLSDAERMRHAEADATSHMAQLDADHEQPQHSLSSFKLPGFQGRRPAAIESGAIY